MISSHSDHFDHSKTSDISDRGKGTNPNSTSYPGHHEPLEVDEIRSQQQQYLNEDRHSNPILWKEHDAGKEKEKQQHSVVPWRTTDRMRTVSVALVLCLNIGTDPPDVIKTSPCARKECWIDPFSMQAQKSLETIGKTLQSQYERWQPKIRCRQSLDPTVEDSKKLCLSLRRNAKSNRVLFHYNGHGVPRPTLNGEIWVFNDNYTQYIPLSVYDLQSWVGTPAIYVLDCSAAGILLSHFVNTETRLDETSTALHRAGETSSNGTTSSSSSSKELIVLAACGANEILPMNPEFPADIFTSCLTTPIMIALRWFISQNSLSMANINPNLIDRIPGKLTDRQTPLGELNWIFTAITDTIAWNVLPRELFQKLFRQDLLLASLFRNFLLADRIMRSVGCTPCSLPRLPPTHQHHLWQSWDLASEICLSQLSKILNPHPSMNLSLTFQDSPFFAEQLTAFEVWLEFASEHKTPPEQLPIVLQVLLSQVHRLRALVLLRRFLDLGPWAVKLALSVGIFPYVLKLLQSQASELRQVLVFIWAKILALDDSCQSDLVRDNGHLYFILHLSSTLTSIPSEQKVMAAFILTVICDKHRHGQAVCLQQQLVGICTNLLQDSDAFLRRWICFCLAKQYEEFEEAKLVALNTRVLENLTDLLSDAIPEVRAAAAYALGHLVSSTLDDQQANVNDRAHSDVLIGCSLLRACADGSPLVRHEGVIALAKLVLHPYHKGFFEITARNRIGKKREDKLFNELDSSSDAAASNKDLLNSIGPDASEYVKIWSSLKEIQAGDPFPKVAHAAILIVGNINMQMLTEGKSSSTTDENGAYNQLHRDASLPDLPLLTDGRLKMAHMQSSSVSKETGIHMLKMQHPKSMNTMNEAEIPSFGNYSGISRLSHSFDPSLSRTMAEKSSVPEDLQSNLYEWSKVDFNKPMMDGAKESEDPLSDTGAARLCRKRKSERFKREAEALSGRENLDTSSFSPNRSSSNASTTTPSLSGSPVASNSHGQGFYNRKLDQSAILDNDSEMTSLLLFHPFETALVVADEKDGISVWNYEEGEKLLHFSNENQIGSRLTSLEWINETDESLLLSGSDDGIVRVWYGLHDCVSIKKPRLLTAFPAVPDLIPGTRGSGLVTQWQQSSGVLICGGNSNVIRIWEMQQEKSIYTVPTGTVACLTSMTCDKSTRSGNIVAGYGDGSLRLFDPRSNPAFSVTSTLMEHQGWVVKIHVQTETHELISGSVSGDIKFWDLRYSKSSVKTIDAHRSPMTALAVHDYAPMLASGSHNQFIKVFNMDGATLSMIRYHDGFLGQRIGPVSCLAFHPHKLYLAAGATDSLISIYSSDK